MEKKRHTGRNVLIIFLAILLLIPVSIYGYLSLGGFHAAKRYAAYQPDAAYTGTVAFRADGVVDVPLSETDIYWLVDHFNGLDKVDDSLRKLLKAYAVELHADSVVLYADGRLFSFLPVPLKVTADAVCKGSEVNLTVSDVHLGKWLSVPLDKLEALGVEKEFTLDLKELDTMYDITDVALEEGRVIISEAFMKPFSKSLLNGIRSSELAFGLYLYEGEPILSEAPIFSTVLGAIPDQNGSDLLPTDIVSVIAASADPQKTLTELFTCMLQEKTDYFVDELGVFEQHFIVEQAVKGAAEKRDAYVERLAAHQNTYEAMLTAVRTHYQELKLTINGTAFLDETGEEVSVAAFTNDSFLHNTESRILLIQSNTVFNAVKTFDMPVLNDVPRTNDGAIAKFYAEIPYDLTVFLKLPCGRYACTYFQGDGYFVMNCVDDATAKHYMNQSKMETLYSENLPKPPVRYRHDPLQDTLSPYVFLVPLPGK